MDSLGAGLDLHHHSCPVLVPGPTAAAAPKNPDGAQLKDVAFGWCFHLHFSINGVLN